MRLASPRRAALTGVLIGALLLSGAPPAQAAAAGSITGRLTTSTGAAAAHAWVVAYDEEDWNSVSWTETDENGYYTVTGLPAGSYLVSYELQSQPQQYHHRKTDIWDADPVTVTDGATTTVNEQLFATGTITGQIRNADGTPRPDLLVTARNPETFDSNYGLTDSEGRYRIPVLPGAHQVSFEPIEGSYQTQYVPGRLAESGGQLFDVAEGTEVTVDDTILAVGSLSGRFTNAAGQPLTNAYIDLSTAGEQGWVGVHAETDGNGEFTVSEILVGSYTLSFSHDDRVQYYQGKLTSEEADAFTVSAGANTHLTDSFLPSGSIRVAVVDATTGTPVTGYCVYDACTDGSGPVTITNLPAGEHEFDVHAYGGAYLSGSTGQVQVIPGQTVQVTVQLRPAARITVTVLDRSSGSPVRDVCVAALRVHGPQLPEGIGDCTDSAGRMTIGRLESGAYNLFALPQETRYGMQWVGASGGTGRQGSAVTVRATEGTTVAGPTVRLDPPGAIAGRVTDGSTGATLADVDVSVLSFSPGGGPPQDVTTDGQGRYRMTGLGPYEWPLLFNRHQYAPQWSGGTPDRHAATGARVTAGGTATLDTALGAGTEVTATVVNQHGTPLDEGHVYARNASTGDIIGMGWMTGGQVSMSVLPGQSVYFGYNVSLGDDYYSGDTRSDVVTPPRKPVPGSGPAASNFGGTGGTYLAPGSRVPSDRAGKAATGESPRRPPIRPGDHPVPAQGPLVVRIVVPTA